MNGSIWVICSATSVNDVHVYDSMLGTIGSPLYVDNWTPPIPLRGLLPWNPNSTVVKVVNRQIVHQKGFVPASISSTQNAPIHTQEHLRRLVGELMRSHEGALKQVHIVLREGSPIVVADVAVEDVKAVLGE